MFRLGELIDAASVGARPCWRKQRYRSEGAADAHLRSVLKRGLERNARIHSYQCPLCEGWHVGHSREDVAPT